MPETATTPTTPTPKELLRLATEALDSLQDTVGYHPQVRRKAHLYNDLAELTWRHTPDKELTAKVALLLANQPSYWERAFTADQDRRLDLAESYLRLARTSALFNSRA